MHLSLAWLPLLALTLASDTGRPNYGLVGYGIEMYVPVCTYACASCFNGGPLWCNDTASMGSGISMRLKRDSSDSMSNMGMFSSAPSAVCLSGSVPYLTSMAWCIHVRCPSSIPAWQVEKWWNTYVVGVNITKTVLADPTLYSALYNSLDVNQNIEIQHETFALVAFLSGVCIPVGFSLLCFLPFPRRWTSWFHGRFVYPSLFRPWRHSPIAAVAGETPTVGQAFFIAYLIILNVFLSAFKYRYNPLGWGYWYDNGPDETMGDLANRLGVLGFANFALLVLYSSRNNLLLWLTDWDFSTFLLLHRWLARIRVRKRAN